MVRKKEDRESSDFPGANKRLDQLGSEVISASSLNESETDEIVSSPFLYSRIRTRITAEALRREEKENWLSVFVVFWRTVPAMALVAVFCLVLFLTSQSSGISTPGLSEDGIPSAPEPGIERAVFAGVQPLSSDEVLTTILGREDGEAVR